ncbi:MULTISPECIES: hypothetical protein [unclassified Sphingomonas]|uniref:hypothetical protein n=1 Tax=unclassified Sphingomonas TaxID=196159 RepID=UPI000929CF68|nr:MULTISPECIES: hypothetical protein [unclassified Sphingomonas]OJV31595.1 MAG: hypothetical protein BGO24_05295 [Sphingomonas sp. 67-36]
MSTRISDRRIAAFLAVALLAGCKERQTATPPPKLAGDLNCAVGGAPGFSRSCALERAETARGLVLTLRHAQGGFRRLLVTKDGRGVVAADGAVPAKVTIVGNNEIEVALGGDRYRLPATIGARR